MKTVTLPAFKAYDIRGKVPAELNEDMAYTVGRAFIAEMRPEGAIAVGRDIRDSSESLATALMRGITDAGVDVVSIGLCGTETVYFASSLAGMGGGVMVTASHNPKGYNGLKIVLREGRPVSADTGLMDIERRVRTGDIPKHAVTPGTMSERDVMAEYARRILTFADLDGMKPLKIVANPGNGCAGPTLDALLEHLPFTVERFHFEPDGTFPSGVPNPLLMENRAATADAVIAAGANFGVAWDGDFDRCFLFDETGAFIEGYYLVGFLARRLLADNPGGKIVLDPRLTWNTLELVAEVGGSPVISKSGHSFIKEKMRETEAVYGGEMSAHHYFRDFTYCDSGMIPWLLIAGELSRTGLRLSELVADRIRRFPCSGEINRSVSDADRALEAVRDHFAAEASDMTTLDGISLEFGDAWRMNLRKSNTEPVVRLNVEARGDDDLMRVMTERVLAVIDTV
jgi:phosphomannomutase